RKRIGIEVSSICGLPSGRPFMIATAEPIMHPHQCSWCASIVYVPGPMFSCKACSGNSCAGRLCTKNTSWALIERPYSCAPQAVGAVYDRPGFFVQSRLAGSKSEEAEHATTECDRLNANVLHCITCGPQRMCARTGTGR